MKAFLSAVLLAITPCAFSQIYDVGFDVVSWAENGAGVSTNGDELTIVGNNSQYYTAEYTLTVDPNIDDLYFTAKIWLENIVGGPDGWDRPKMRIESTTGAKLINYNISSGIEGQWVHTGVQLSNFKNMGLTQIVLIFGMQNTGGTMKVTEALVSSDKTTGEYVFPYPIPGDPSVTLDVNTTESHKFNDDLLSTNCHFTWAPKNWEDETVKQMIYEKFPMQNLRFPGGTVANFYNWQTDDFYANSYSANNNTAQNGSQDAKVFGYPGYLDVTKTLGGNSTLLFNVFSDDKATSQARLQARLDDGLDVKWIEMGNENYFTDQAYGFVDDRETGINGNNDGHFYDEYIKHTTELAQWLKEIKPDIKVAVNTHDDDWNNPIAAENYYDACVMHNYIFNNSFIMNQFAASEYIGAYRTTQNRLDGFVSTFGNKPVLMSEWGLLSDMPASFLQVICAADNFLSIEKGNQRGIVEQAGIHMLYHGDFVGEGSLISNDGTGLGINPIGVMYSKLYEVFIGNKVYDAYSTSEELETDLDGVYAKAIDLGDSVYVYAVNKLPVASPLNLSFDGVPYTGAFEMENYSEDMSIELTQNYSLSENPWVQSSGTGGISLPANSITIVTIQKSEFQTVCEAPQLGGNTNLCGRSQFDLNSNVSATNRTLTWYKNDVEINGESGESLTVMTEGIYKVVADSLGCIREDEIIVSDQFPSIYLGSDLDFCTTTMKVLNADVNNPEVTFTWYKNEEALPESTSLLNVFSSGIYRVEASAAGCTSVSDEISITSGLVDVSFDTICEAGTASLEINDSGSFAWYDLQNDGTQLSSDLVYEPSINASTVFYVQDNNIEQHDLGLPLPIGTLYGGSDDYTLWGRTMYMNVEKGFIWNTADIFTNTGVDLVMNITGTGGTFQYAESGIPNTGKTSAYTLNLNQYIPAGDYEINLVGTTGKVFVQVSDKSNAEVADVVEFGGTDGADHYGFFYNWDITTSSECVRTPVHAVIDPNKSGCIIMSMNNEGRMNSIEIYPNPSSGGVVHFTSSLHHVSVVNLLGEVVQTASIMDELETSLLPKGIYIVKADEVTLKLLVE